MLDRFGQIEPKVLIVCDGYWYAGKPIDVSDKVAELVAQQLPTVERIIVTSYLGTADAVVQQPQCEPRRTAAAPRRGTPPSSARHRSR